MNVSSPQQALRASAGLLVSLVAAGFAVASPASAAHDEDLVQYASVPALTPSQIRLFNKPYQIPKNPHVLGAWSPPIFFEKLSPNAALLPTGKVLFFGKRADLFCAVFDPKTKEIKNIELPGGWNPTCSGHMLMPDGRLLAFGGIHKAVSFVAHRETHYFDPWTEEWEQLGDMNQGRFYPSGALLGDGRVVTFGGSSDVIGHGKRNLDVESFDPLDRQGRWELVTSRELDWYPLLHLMGNGQIFMSGPGESTEFYDPLTSTWTPVADRLVPTRFYAPSVLIPPGNSRVMVIGGQLGSQTGGGLVTGSVEEIDLLSSTPEWRFRKQMLHDRTDHSAVILPDQTILVVGGRTTSGSTTDDDAVFVPEVYSPTADRWTPLAPHAHPRTQHSTALLLPDARVLAAGRPEIQSAEIYSPPYLFRGPRPTIADAPEELAYGSTFTLEFESPRSTNRVCLIRFASITHSVSFGQRYVDLGEHSGNKGPITVATPGDRSAAPPGYYMLFVVTDEGVPSVSATVQLR